MEIPVKIAYRGLESSATVSELVRKKAARLERYFPRITSCGVTVQAPGAHHRRGKGKHYRVRIELSVPGEKLVVGRDPAKTRSHEDLYAALNAAFREARRQLEDHGRRFDHRVQAGERAEPARGTVVRLFPVDGYGFLQTPDGREIYFAGASVLKGAFKRLKVGGEVRYVEEMGDKGPQASTVAVARSERKHG